MASKDYDDLLESFMNNSTKAYAEDKVTREKIDEEKAERNAQTKQEIPKDKKKRRGRNIEKEMKAAKTKKSKTYKSPAKRFFSGFAKVLLGIVMVIGVVGIVCTSVLVIYGYSVVYGDAVFDLDTEKYSQNQTSFIYGYDDDEVVEITRLHGEENRIWVDLDDMSEHMAEAFIAIEDKRFYSHSGVDWIRTLGVIINPNYEGQGGSTITQQLIKNLTDENQATYVRKFNEILQALNIERYNDKDTIIEAYLNTIYLSNGCYGVKTAAEVYFGKEVSDLNIAECASIAAITQYPSRYDPLENPDNNRERQLEILAAMLSEGYITQDEYDEAVEYDMVFTNSPDYKGSQVADDDSSEDEEINSYYVDYVITSVIEDLQKMGYSSRKAKSLVYGGGLKIYTAIDFDVQEALENVYENYENMPDETIEGAMCIMDYEGRVLGIIGGTGEKTANLVLNRATQSTRQPGSTIKPLSVYGPALQKSHDDDDTQIYWSTMIADKPLMEVDGEPWPTNSGSYTGATRTLQYGLSRSLNTISARTLDMISVDYSFEYITEKFHISTLDSINDVDYAPMATGSLTNGVTVLEMTAAYATFGNGGSYYEPYCYYKIEDSQGNVIIEKNPEDTKEEALSESTAWLMNKLLQTVTTEGTGTSFKLSGIECYAKTGTTTDNYDRWYVSGTPDYIAAVWYGYDSPKKISYSLSSNPAGTIWKTVFNDIYQNLEDNGEEYDTEFPESDTIVKKAYCTSCGKLAKSGGKYGWFAADNLPDYCSGHAVATTKKATTTSADDSDSEETTNKSSKKVSEDATTSQETTKKSKSSNSQSDEDSNDDDSE